MELTPEREQELIESLARRVQRLGLIAPAILFLESNKPFSFIGSQALLFFQPVLRMLSPERVDEYVALFERRECVERLIERLEDMADEE